MQQAVSHTGSRSSERRNSPSLTMLDQVRIPLGVAQRAALVRICQEDFQRIKQKVREELLARGQSVTDEYLERGIQALRQYHAVAILDPRNEHAISDALDPFWHVQILFTRQYVRFCNETMGHYVHHEPLDHADLAAVQHVANLYRHTNKRLEDIFGQVLDREFFPSVLTEDRLVCRHCQCFNEALLSETRYEQVYACATH